VDAWGAKASSPLLRPLLLPEAFALRLFVGGQRYRGLIGSPSAGPIRWVPIPTSRLPIPSESVWVGVSMATEDGRVGKGDYIES